MDYEKRVDELLEKYGGRKGSVLVQRNYDLKEESAVALITLIVEEEARDARTTLIGEQRNAGRSQAASQVVPGSFVPATAKQLEALRGFKVAVGDPKLMSKEHASELISKAIEEARKQRG